LSDGPVGRFGWSHRQPANGRCNSSASLILPGHQCLDRRLSPPRLGHLDRHPPL